MKHLKIIQKILLPIVCVGLSIYLPSCSETENHRLLTSAEKIMQENPDSAKTILDKIDTAKLSGNKEDKALYALLRSQVKDKLYDYTTDDSLINIAVEYYNSPKKDPRHYMLSRYYLGRINFHSNKYSNGLINFFKALEAAEGLNDKYWIGLSCRGISDIYNKTFDGQEEVFYARKEYDAFKEAGIQPYLNYALLDLCISLSSVRNFKEVEKISNQLLDSAKVYNEVV